MDESAAIAQLKQGDISGLETLVRQHYFQAVRTAYLITHNVAQAEDVVQTAFLRVYERIQQFDSLRPFASWFSRIVVNDAIKAATRQSLHEVGLADEIQAEMSSDELEPQTWLEQLETRQEVWQALSQLSPMQRAAIVCRYYLELSEAETAERLECAPGTVKAHLHIARRRLRVLLYDLQPAPATHPKPGKLNGGVR